MNITNENFFPEQLSRENTQTHSESGQAYKTCRHDRAKRFLLQYCRDFCRSRIIEKTFQAELFIQWYYL